MPQPGLTTIGYLGSLQMLPWSWCQKQDFTELPHCTLEPNVVCGCWPALAACLVPLLHLRRLVGWLSSVGSVEAFACLPLPRPTGALVLMLSIFTLS